MFLGEPIKIWIALFVGAVIAAELSGRAALAGQFQMGAISFGVGYLSYADVAAWAGRSEVFAALIVTGCGYWLFTLVMALFADREFLRTTLLTLLGGRKP